LSKKESQLTNGTFADYFLPVAADLPDIVVEHVETPWPHRAWAQREPVRRRRRHHECGE
jgi:CO/xanthine dehydrogenase Mo-binding subunit